MRSVVLLLAALASHDAALIDECRYENDAAAQAAWEPMRGSAPATAAVLEGRRALHLPCNFATAMVERASWDRKVQLDLAPFQGVEFRFFSKNLAPVSHFSIYFQSGNGWYSGSFFPKSSGAWNTIVVEKSEMRTEGQPAGWAPSGPSASPPGAGAMRTRNSTSPISAVLACWAPML